MLYVSICSTRDMQLLKRRVVSLQLALRPLWQRSLPAADHKWVLQALFREGRRGAELRQHVQLWYHPPSRPLVYAAAFICRRLLPTSAMPVDAVQDVVSETFVLGACRSRLSTRSTFHGAT